MADEADNQGRTPDALKDIRQTYTESLKMAFELLKHATTLSAGALVLISSLHPALSATGKNVLSLGFGLLCASIVASLIEMMILTFAHFDIALASIRPHPSISDKDKSLQSLTLACFLVSLGGFGGGIVCVSLAASFFRA